MLITPAASVFSALNPAYGGAARDAQQIATRKRTWHPETGTPWKNYPHGY